MFLLNLEHLTYHGRVQSLGAETIPKNIGCADRFGLDISEVLHPTVAEHVDFVGKRGVAGRGGGGKNQDITPQTLKVRVACPKSPYLRSLSEDSSAIIGVSWV